eukprot:PhF_6_TR5534/c0_g1_i2/m.7865
MKHEIVVRVSAIGVLIVFVILSQVRSFLAVSHPAPPLVVTHTIPDATPPLTGKALLAQQLENDLASGGFLTSTNSFEQQMETIRSEFGNHGTLEVGGVSAWELKDHPYIALYTANNG